MRLVALVVFLTIVLSSANAEPIQCLGSTNMAALMALNAGGGCFSQDKVYDNFDYTPTAGGNATSADNVTATLNFQQLGAVDVHGWTFADNWQQNFISGQLAGFTVGFRIRICTATDPCSGGGATIVGADAIFTPVAGLANPMEVVTWSPASNPGLSPQTLTLASPGPLPSPFNNGVVSGDGPFTVSAVFNGSGALSSTTLRFYQEVPVTPPPVPEPATLVLFGAGLVGLGLLRKRRGV